MWRYNDADGITETYVYVDVPERWLRIKEPLRHFIECHRSSPLPVAGRYKLWDGVVRAGLPVADTARAGGAGG